MGPQDPVGLTTLGSRLPRSNAFAKAPAATPARQGHEATDSGQPALQTGLLKFVIWTFGQMACEQAAF